MRPVSVLLFILLPILGMAQSKVAQVLEDVTEVDYVSSTNVTTHHRRTVMVYNAKGLSAAEFYCSCNASATLTKFSGEILNTTRTSLKKVKKSDLKQTEYSPHLASDAYYFFFHPRYSPILPLSPTNGRSTKRMPCWDLTFSVPCPTMMWQ